MKDENESESVATEDIQELYRLLGGYRVSQALYVITKLGIPDLLADGPQSSEALAQVTGTHAEALYRVLRFLAGNGIFTELAPQRFALTALGSGLCRNVPGSMHSTVLMHLDPSKWQPWGHLLDSVYTGETAFGQIHHVGVFDYLALHPDAAAVFQSAMTNNTARSGTAIIRAYDFSDIAFLVDVGGGQGLLLATILQAHPTLRGILFDRPEVVAEAGAALTAAGVAARCESIGGDFFATIPAKGDAYLLRHILHDWDDAHATVILQNCRQAMHPQGKVLVVERTIAANPQEALPILHLDLEMLVNYGGKERTDEEYRVLFAAADLQLSSVIPLSDMAGFSLYVGVQA